MRFNADDWDYAELETGDTTLAFAALNMADILGFHDQPNRADTPAPGIELAFVTEEVQRAFTRATKPAPIGHGASADPMGPNRLVCPRSERRPDRDLLPRQWLGIRGRTDRSVHIGLIPAP